LSTLAHVLLAAVVAAPAGNLGIVAKPGLSAIRPEALSAHIRYLADDLLEGRGTGTRGHAIAARYVAAQLQSLGYQPAGNGQTYFQSVPFVGTTVDADHCALEVDAVPLKHGDEVVFTPRAGATGDDVTGDLVFAGYGIHAPAYGYEDVPKDLRGKIAVILFGAPRSDRDDFFPTAASAVYSDTANKTKLLASRGALGIVLVVTPQILTASPWDLFVRGAAFERMVWKEGDRVGSASVLPMAVIPPGGLASLLVKSGQNADRLFAAGPKGELEPFPLGARGHLRVASTVRQVTSENVVAVLRGSERPSEYVALTGHLDHLGIGPPINGDSIYNGAVDNAAGVAGVLEIARAFASLPKRASRSILVVVVTAEEKGLQGSDYFAQHPTVPIRSIVANVNLDGIEGAWEPHDLFALGAEHSSVEAAVRFAARATGLKISPDPDPDQVYFIRSDQYSFVKQGVPSVFPHAGWLDEDGKIEKNRSHYLWWFKNRYHQPSDEWVPSLNYENMAKEIRADFLIALYLALDPERPRWNRGDIFEKLFAQ